MSEHTARLERFAKLRQLKERTGAPLSACDEALKACDGDIEAAAEHPATRRTRGYDGDPFHRCQDDCPPWPFRWGGPGRVSGHPCNTHCRRHPDPRTHSLDVLRETLPLDETTARRVLDICDWNHARAVEFVHRMRETAERTPR